MYSFKVVCASECFFESTPFNINFVHDTIIYLKFVIFLKDFIQG